MDDITKTKPQLTIDVVSDVVCPWCFIGKRRLEKAIALRPDLDAEVRWHPFFLNPWVPREGIDRETYLKTKFGSVERYNDISKRITAAGAEEQIPFALDKIKRQPNTIDCHRLIHWARLEGDASAVKERLMALYFIEGADLSDPEVLVRAGTDCGMDGALVRRLLASDADVAGGRSRGQTRKRLRHQRRALLHPRRHARGVRRAGAGVSRRRDGPRGGGTVHAERLRKRSAVAS